jgi:hypothetical protein
MVVLRGSISGDMRLGGPLVFVSPNRIMVPAQKELEQAAQHRRPALLPLVAAALCASVLVFVHQDQAPAVLSTARAKGSIRGSAEEQRLNAAAARAALAQKLVAEKAVTAADAVVAEAGRVGKPQGGGKVPAHCMRYAASLPLLSIDAK